MCVYLYIYVYMHLCMCTYRNDITSPGGTTASAIYNLERGGFRTTGRHLMQCVAGCCSVLQCAVVCCCAPCTSSYGKYIVYMYVYTHVYIYVYMYIHEYIYVHKIDMYI